MRKTVASSAFKGASTAMNSNVFQLQSEGAKKGQFKDTMDALKVLASTEFKKDIAYLEPMFKKLEQPVIPKPIKPEATSVRRDSTGKETTVKTDEVDFDIYREKVKSYISLEMRLENTTRALYNIVWGQSSRLLQNKLRSKKDFEQIDDKGDVVSLLREIRKISHQAEDSVCVYDSLDEVLRRFYTYVQSPEEDNATHLVRFREFIDVLDHFEVDMFQDTCLINYEKDLDKKLGRSADTDENLKKRVKNKQLGTCFLRRSNMRLYSGLMRSLRDQFLHGFDVYPKSVEEAYTLLQNHSSSKRMERGRPAPQSDAKPGGLPKRPTVNVIPRDDLRSGTQHAQRAPAEAQEPPKTDKANLPDAVAGADGNINVNVKCYNCNKRGHYANNCPLESAATQHFMTDNQITDQTSGNEDFEFGFQFMGTKTTNHVDKMSILLDTGSNVSVFNNKQYLTDIRKCDHSFPVHTNGGVFETNEVGDLPHFFPVYYNPSSMLNILSFAEVKQRYRITMDTANDDSIIVHIHEGHTLEFSEVKTGLYLLNRKCFNTINKKVTAYSHLSLVSSNKNNFTTRQIQGAERARLLYKNINMPGYTKFVKLIQNNYFRDSPVTTEDVKRAIFIYGKDTATLQGKATRQPSAPTSIINPVQLPKSIRDFHNKVPVSVDIMLIQSIPFLTSISGTTYRFRTVEPIFKARPNKQDLSECITNVQRTYTNRGIQVSQINADNEFECLRGDLGPTTLNTVGAEEHVGEIERSIRTIKEGTRTVIHSLPYTHYTRAMVSGLVIRVTQGLNELPANDGVSKELSPQTLIMGSPPPSYKDLTELAFGDYVETAQGATKSTTTSRTMGAIALFPSRNSSKSWYFMSLGTGAIIHRYSWDKLPASEDVLSRVRELALKQKQPRISKNFKYEWKAGSEIQDLPEENIEEEQVDEQTAAVELPTSESDGTLTSSIEKIRRNESTEPQIMESAQEEDDSLSHDPDAQNQELAEVENSVDQTIEVQDQITEEEQETSVYVPDSVDGENEVSNISIPIASEVEAREDNELSENEVEEEPQVSTQELQEASRSARTVVEELDNENERPSRSRPSIDYRAWHKYGRKQMMNMKGSKPSRVTKNKSTSKDMFRGVMRVMMAQIQAISEHEDLSIKEGIKRYGHYAVESVLAEYGQLKDKSVFKPKYANTLSIEERRNSLNLITFMKKKRSGKLKTRACADGRKQRLYIKKEEASSPAIHLESLLLTMMVDAHEGRDVATADISGAYLLADMKDYVLVRLEGESADIMCKVDPAYQKYRTYNKKGKPVLYLQLVKALYGCLQSALRWYETFVCKLKDMGFTINPYDPCVANAEIEGSQCTICWYVDDTKISHINPEVVTKVIEEMESAFGKMEIKRGRNHVFVGMDFTLTEDHKLSISMKEYVDECIEAFEEVDRKLEGKANTPAKNGLFIVTEGEEELDERKSEYFHHVVAKLLYVAKRARLDIDLAVSFLCTRVSRSTTEDWEKLRRLLLYLKGTLLMPRILGADRLDTVRTWVDASYGTHNDMKGHTGGAMSMGTGVFNVKSTKQKLNTKSSTETEVVGVSDYLPWVVWTKMFMEEQGRKIKSNILYQDNESAIRIEKNGRKSCREKSRHIHIRYFFVTDLIKREELSVEHCRTEKMVSDFYTKPLQGHLFRDMRDFIMGAAPLPVEERVEKQSSTEKKEEIIKKEDSMDLREKDNLKSILRKSTDNESVMKKVTYADAVKSTMWE